MIYLKLDNKPNNLKELFIELFAYRYGSTRKSVQTYKDEECTSVECLPNKYRSIDDILKISRTYFPDSTNKEIINDLLHLVIKKNDREYYPYLIHCPNISKPTICFDRNNCPRLNDQFEHDDMNESQFKDWKEICSAIGITTREELMNLHEED